MYITFVITETIVITKTFDPSFSFSMNSILIFIIMYCFLIKEGRHNFVFYHWQLCLICFGYYHNVPVYQSMIQTLDHKYCNLIFKWGHNSLFLLAWIFLFTCIDLPLILIFFLLSGKQLQFRRSNTWRGSSNTEEHIRCSLSKSWQTHHHLYDWPLWASWHYSL